MNDCTSTAYAGSTIILMARVLVTDGTVLTTADVTTMTLTATGDDSPAFVPWGGCQPGSPPSSHTGLLRDRVFFGYDERSQSVVIGPQLINGRSGGRVPVPELLDQGGDSRTAKGEKATYAAFPFVKPALDAERANFPGLLRDAIR